MNSGIPPRVVTVGIQGRGSSTVADFGILGPIVRDKANVELRPVLEDDIMTRLDWLRSGKIDLFYESSFIPAQNEANRPGEMERSRGPLDMHILASAHSGACGYMVRGDSPIRTIHDIGPDTRIAITDMVANRVYALLAWLGLNEGPIMADPSATHWKVELVRFSSWEANLRSIEERRADVATATPQNPLVRRAAAGPYGIRFLDLPVKAEPDGARRFRQVLPFTHLIPAPEEGVEEIWGVTCMVGAACLWCRPDFDEDVDYGLTKCFDESYEAFKDRGNKLVTYTLDVLNQVAGTAMAPVHAGTVRYLKAKGLWTAAGDARQEYNQRLISWYRDLWEQAISRADREGIEVAGANPAWASLWAGCKKEARVPRYRLMNDEEIEAGTRLLKAAGR